MKKLQLFVSLIFLWLAFSASATNYDVSGAGTTAANGTYTENGTSGGYAQYKFGDYTMQYSSTYNRWQIIVPVGSKGEIEVLYTAKTKVVSNIPPFTEWSTLGGLAPAPSVGVAEAPPAVNYIVSGAGNTATNGTYTESGTYLSNPQYRLGTTNYYLRYADSKWQIMQTVKEYIYKYYTNTDYNGGTPPSTGWVTVYKIGKDPAPTVAIDALSLSYSATLFTESSADDGTISTTITITHNGSGGESFTGSDNDNFVSSGKVIITNLPSGLTAVITRTSATTCTAALSGTASSHNNADDITNLTFAFQNSAFSGGDASQVSNATKSDLVINFIPDPGYVVYGAGTTATNGTYTESGTYLSKPQYKLGDKYYLRSRTKPGWEILVIDGEKQTIYYFTETAGSTPPETGWKRSSGSDPVPDVYLATIKLTYSATLFTESSANDGTINNAAITITHNGYGGATFTGSDNDDFVSAGKVVVTNLPSGLTAMVTRTSATTCTATLSGTASSHMDANDVTNLSFDFQNSAFSGGDASVVKDVTKSNLEINFIQEYSIGSGGDYASIGAALSAFSAFNSDGNILNLAAETFTENNLQISNLTIRGQGAGSTIVQGAASQGTATYGVFITTNTVILEDMTIQHGDANAHPDDGDDHYSNFGGGIYNNAGNLTVNNCNITNNEARYWGGGIYHRDGNLTVNNSTISNNKIVGPNINIAYGPGSAIFSGSNTINTTCTLTNCTVVGNNTSVITKLGALASRNWNSLVSTFTINNSTVYGNDAGLFSDLGGIFIVQNSIIAGNGSKDYQEESGPGTVSGNGHNIVETQLAFRFNHATDILFNYKADGTAGTAWTQNSVALGNQNLNMADSLADNNTANETQTIAIESGSFAIGAGIPITSITKDQRGFTRVNPTTIGAYAFEGVQTPTVSTQAVSSIKRTTASGNGNIEDLGLFNPTAHGFCWNTTGSPTLTDSIIDEGATSSTGAFTSSITELTPVTTYYVRAYATNDSGTVYGNEVSFSTPYINDQEVSALPTSICADSSSTISLASSEIEVSYTLRDDDNDTIIDGPTAGTGSSIEFSTGALSASKTFNVLAERSKPETSGALNFDGINNYIQVPDVASLKLSSGVFSIEFWANPSIADGGHHWIISKEYSNTDLDYLIGSSSNKWRFIARNLSIDISAETEFTAGTWYHIACTFDGTTATLYVDGVAVGTDMTVGSSVTNNAPLFISQRNGGQYYAGKLDDIRLWNTSRSALEVANNMNTNYTGSEDGLVALYNFEDGTGSSILSDGTSNNNDGTLTSMNTETDWGTRETSTTYSAEMLTTPTVTVRPVFTSGEIETTGDTVTYNGDPAVIGSATAANGGDEMITYKWESSLDTFATAGSIISGATAATYDPPTGIEASTSYRRYAHDATCNTAFEQSTGTWLVTVTKATPIVSTWPTATGIIYGDSLASATLSGGSSSVPGSFAYNDTTITPNTGTYSAALTFTPTDSSNYTTVAGNIDVAVAKATPTVTTWPTAAGISYGEDLSLATLSGGEASVVGSFAYNDTTITPNAGNYSASLTFTPTDSSNYSTVAGNVNVAVSKATPTVSEWPSATGITYGGDLADATLNGGAASVDGSFAYNDTTITPNAGNYSTALTFTPTDSSNYSTVAGNVNIAVAKVTPEITWVDPEDIVSGTALSATQLNATAGVDGTFEYSPALGTILGSGNSQTLSVVFTPADNVNYNNANANASINVSVVTSLENNSILKLSIYPNPASDILYIKNGSGDKYTIYSVSGQQMQIGPITNRIRIDGLISGFYILEVQGEKHRFIKK